MNGYITKKNYLYRLQQLIVLILHLILLKWMIFTLHESGIMTSMEVFMHFTGMSIYGGLLIFGTAKWAKRIHEKELYEDQ